MACLPGDMRAATAAVCSLPLLVLTGCRNPVGVSRTENPLVATYTVAPSRDATVSVDFGPDTTYPLHTSALPTPSGGGPVTVLVAGMKPNTTYHLRAHTHYLDGADEFDGDHTFTTGPVPANLLPPISVAASSSLPPTSGVELYQLTPGPSGQYQLLALDTAGNLIWYYTQIGKSDVPQGAKLLPNGHIIVVIGTVAPITAILREIDLAGNTVWTLTTSELYGLLTSAGISIVPTGMHHDVLPLPNGHLIVLVSFIKKFTDLPGYPGTTPVQGDALFDLDPNHKIVWSWSSFDHLDVNRHPMFFPDWLHSNALLYTSGDGNLLLSMRHQSWVIKIDYENGKGDGHIIWRLGYQGDFALLNGRDPTDWFFAQHYPSFVGAEDTGDFRLALFDNGDNRIMDSNGTICGTSGAPACYSRIPIFEVNESAKTATLVWDNNLSPIYSFWGGSVQVLDNGHMFVDETTPSDLPGLGTRYLEITQEAPLQPLLDITLMGQNAYRTIRLPSLYPGVQW